MMKRILASLLLLTLAKTSVANTELEELKNIIQTLTNKVNELTKEVDKLKANASPAIQQQVVDKKQPLSLEPDEIQSINSSESQHVLSNPWWNNINISGFGAVGAYGTGDDANKGEWGFEIKEATVFIEAAVWENIDLFLELQTNRLGDDKSKYTRTGEVYVHLRDIEVADSTIGFKLGRIDLPFGEEYLWQDAIDNPLIQTSVSYPYGWDEGALVYGETQGVGWIFSITDGNDERSLEDDKEKAINAKFYGDISENLYMSFSLMRNGSSMESAMEFGGSHFEPVEGSSSEFVDSWLAEFDAKYNYSLGSKTGYLALALGTAKQSDDDSAYDRDIHWFTIEPLLNLNETWYTAVRYSEIGTYDSDEGYHFDGKPFAGGNEAYGYDVERFRRLSVGLGWKPNPRTRIKFEAGNDWYDLIDSSTRDKGDDRNFIGAEIAVGF